MRCLRCSNETLPGKALCASCFAAHQKKVELEETDEWVKQQLASTRSESRGRERETKGSETSLQSLILTLAPALLAMGGLIMFSTWALNNLSFTYTTNPESSSIPGALSTPSSKTPSQPNAFNQALPKQPPISAAQTPQENREAQVQLASQTLTPQPTATPTNTPTATPTAQSQPLT
jgi:hypothetical protein